MTDPDAELAAKPAAKTSNRPRGPTCASCIHLLDQVHHGGEPTHGHCRRFPPVGGGMQGAQFPRVGLDALCGEHPEMRALVATAPEA